MDNFWLYILNYLFFIIHTVLIVFNLFGWLLKNVRKIHLVTMSLTLFSWVILGIWKGFGYCILTDWHYTILRQLGKSDIPNSYIALLIETFSGWQPDTHLVNFFTLLFTALAFGGSLWVNFGKRYAE